MKVCSFPLFPEVCKFYWKTGRYSIHKDKSILACNNYGQQVLTLAIIERPPLHQSATINPNQAIMCLARW